jgi:hypothetical protein
VLRKAYVGVVPTCVIWDMEERSWDTPAGDGRNLDKDISDNDEEDEGAGDVEDVWAGMEDIDDDDDEDDTEAPKRRKK